jgi:hypothetical protein
MISITLTVKIAKKRHLQIVHSNHEAKKEDLLTCEDKAIPLLTLIYSRHK